MTVAALACTAPLSACSGGSGESTSTTTVTSTPDAGTSSGAEARTPSTATGQGSACTGAFTTALDLRPETVDEAKAQDGLSACWDPATNRVRIVNGSLVVWTVDRPPGIHWSYSATSSKVRAFRTLLPLRSANGLAIEPQEAAELPYSPDQIHLKLDPAATAMWQTLDLTQTALQGKVRDGVAGALSGRSPLRGTVTQCALAGYDAGQLMQTQRQQLQQAPAEVLADVLGLTSQTKSCGSAVLSTERKFGSGVIDLEDFQLTARSAKWSAPTSSAMDIALDAFGHGLRPRIP